MKLISDEEMVDIRKSCEYPMFKSGQEPDGEIAFMASDERRVHSGIAQAQLDSCEKQLKEKLDKLTALNPEEIKIVLAGYRHLSSPMGRMRGVAKAQLDDVKRRLTNETR